MSVCIRDLTLRLLLLCYGYVYPGNRVKKKKRERTITARASFPTVTNSENRIPHQTHTPTTQTHPTSDSP